MFRPYAYCSSLEIRLFLDLDFFEYRSLVNYSVLLLSKIDFWAPENKNVIGKMYLSKDFLALFSKIYLLKLTIRGEPSSIKGFAMKGYLIKRIPLEVLHSFIELIQSSEHGKKESLQEFQYFKNSFFKKNISISRLILIIGSYKRYGNLR